MVLASLLVLRVTFDLFRFCIFPQMIKFLKTEAEYLSLLKCVIQHVVKPFLSVCATGTSSKNLLSSHKDSNISSSGGGSGSSGRTVLNCYASLYVLFYTMVTKWKFVKNKPHHSIHTQKCICSFSPHACTPLLSSSASLLSLPTPST